MTKVYVRGDDSRQIVKTSKPSRPVVLAGVRGRPGRDGVDGATIDPDPDNQIENRQGGLYVEPSTWDRKEW